MERGVFVVMLNVLFLSLLLSLVIAYSSSKPSLNSTNLFLNKQPFHSNIASINALLRTTRFTCPVLLLQDPPSDPTVTYAPSASPTPLLSKSPSPIKPNPIPSRYYPTQSTFSSSSANNVQQTVTRVVGGASLSRSLRPYLAVLIFVKNGDRGVCSATLVSPTLLITAAHCVPENTPSELDVYVGGSQGVPANGIRYSVSSINPHPNFDVHDRDSTRFDIAWVELATPVRNPSFMRVAADESMPATGSIVRNAGYGLHQPQDGSSNPNFEVHQIDIPVTNSSYCHFRWSIYDVEISSRRQICAGYLRGGCGSCNGDSGGPIFQYDGNNRPVLLGVASIAVYCSLTNVPTVYVRVSAFLNNFLPASRLSLAKSTKQVFLPSNNLSNPYGYTPEPAPQSTNPFDNPDPFLPGWNRIILYVGIGVCALIVVFGFLCIRQRFVGRPSNSSPQPTPQPQITSAAPSAIISTQPQPLYPQQPQPVYSQPYDPNIPNIVRNTNGIQ